MATLTNDAEADIGWHRPHVAAEEACYLVQELFGIEPDSASVRQLDSYDDVNYYVCASSPERPKCNEYVLKVHNARDTAHVATLEAQHSVMLHLAAHGIQCSLPLPLAAAPHPEHAAPTPAPCLQGPAGGDKQLAASVAKSSGGRRVTSFGQHIALVQLPCLHAHDTPHASVTQPATAEAEAPPPPPPPPPDLPAASSSSSSSSRGRQEGPGACMSRTVHAVRCLRWLPGKLMAQVPQVPSVHSSLGRLMGRVSSTLALGPALPALNRQHAWHCHTSLPTVQRLMPQVQGLSPGQAQLLLDWMHDQEAAGPQLQQLPCQLCHSDANENNIVMSEDGRKAAGLIDFGDCCYSWRVSEVAIAMLYAMLQLVPPPDRTPPSLLSPPSDQQGLGQAPPSMEAVFAAGWRVLAGFQELVPLTPLELHSLPLLLRARLCLSLSHGRVAAQRTPSNAQYLLLTQQPGWRLLELLHAAPHISQWDPARTTSGA